MITQINELVIFFSSISQKEKCFRCVIVISSSTFDKNGVCLSNILDEICFLQK